MTAPPLEHLLKLAVAFAEEAGRFTLDYFRSDALSLEHKGDGSPVTAADRGAERLIRERIAAHYPGHDILGEEYGETDSGAEFRWLIDPIDGTKSFVHGAPLYGVLIAIEYKREPVVGVIHIPALKETVSAARGLGCHFNGTRCAVSTKTELSQAMVCVTDVRDAQDRGPGYGHLARRTALQRTWGDCYGYVMVATGRADVAMDAEMAPWDCAALIPVIEEAGGRFSSWQGERTISGGDAVATNGKLHAEVIALLKDQDS